MKFHGSLSFLTDLEKLLSIGGDIGPRIGLILLPPSIRIDFNLPLPDISVGAFGLSNLRLDNRVSLPFDGKPLQCRFSLAEWEAPFHVRVGIFGGGGSFSVTVALTPPNLVQDMQVCLEFGGMFDVNLLGLVQGSVSAVGGLCYHYEFPSNMMAICYFRCSGSVSVLHLVGGSMDYYMALGFYSTSGRTEFAGVVEVTFEVHLLFFSWSKTFSVGRTIEGSVSSSENARSSTPLRGLPANVGSSNTQQLGIADFYSAADFEVYWAAFA